MKKVIGISLLFLALIVFCSVLLRPKNGILPNENSSDDTGLGVAVPSLEAVKVIQDVEKPDPDDPRLHRLADGRVEFLPSIVTSQQITSDTKTARRIRIIKSLIEDFRYVYKENPVAGENSEVVAQLLGQNSMKVVFIDSESPALRFNQLVDEWGCPLFFHALTSINMEIRSAGVDKMMWTDDDLISE